MAAATSLDVTPSDIPHTYRHPWALLVTAGKRLGNVTCSLDCVSRMGCESHLHMASAHMTSLRSVLRPLSKRTAQGPPQCDHQPVTQPSVEGKSLFSGINPVCSMWPCLHNSPSHAHRLRSSILSYASSMGTEWVNIYLLLLLQAGMRQWSWSFPVVCPRVFGGGLGKDWAFQRAGYVVHQDRLKVLPPDSP